MKHMEKGIVAGWDYVRVLESENRELLDALRGLLRAFESDNEQAPEISISTCWQTNSQHINKARALLARIDGENNGR